MSRNRPIDKLGRFVARDLKDRFMESVKIDQDSGCWLWTGCLQRDGYGMSSINSKGMVAHRVSYIIKHGSIPARYNVCHKCDVRICVNPDHLFLGTQKQNIQDMDKKGRRAPAQAFISGAKLTEAQVIEIRKLWDMEITTQRELGEMFGVKTMSIWRIVNRLVWKHLP